MSFIIYDLIGMALFTLAAVLFLTRHKSNLKRQGIMYLYRTKIGLRIIESTSKRYARILKPLQYIILASGYLLMIIMFIILVRFAWFYIQSSYLAQTIKVPVIFPLIPYLPEIFKIDFLPPFYFTYWIIIIALIAIPHEFAHGIIARLNNIRVHSTGFGFLGPFLAAFVEPDEKKMAKSPKFAQLSVLAAGTFANVLVTLFFIGVIWIFFTTAFTPAGVHFNTYAATTLPLETITHIDGISAAAFSFASLPLQKDIPFITIQANNHTYYTSSDVLKQTSEQNLSYLAVYEDAPAFNAKLAGAITHVDSMPIHSYDDLRRVLQQHKPGDTITITTIDNKQTKNTTLILAERDGKAYLGIGVIPLQTKGFLGKVYAFLTSMKDPTIYYKSSLGDLGTFVYNLLWWIILVSISVALTNMLPVGLFDGGRFFMLTIWGITGNKKMGEQAFKFSTLLVLVIVALLMIKWIFAVF